MQKLFSRSSCRILSVLIALLLSLPGLASGQSKPGATSATGAASSGTSQSAAQNARGDKKINILYPTSQEDWSTPSLKGSDFEQTSSIFGEKSENPGFTRELTRVEWRLSDPIDLYIMKPAGVKKPPVVIYLFSYPYLNSQFRNNDFCRKLTQNGVAAVGFSTAYTDQRFHPPIHLTDWFVGSMDKALSESAHDVQLLLNYLAARGDFDMDRVGIWGDGSGATIGILAAAVDPRIKTLDVLDPWGDWPDWMAKSSIIPEKERAGLNKPEFLKRAEPLDPVKWLPQLKTDRMRLTEVGDVTITPPAAREKIEAAAPHGMQIVRYEDRRAFAAVASGGRGFDWIKEQLKSTRIDASGAPPRQRRPEEVTNR